MRSAAVKTLSAPVKPALAALLFILAASAFAPEASALPGIDRTPADQLGPGEKARWVCGPYRCWWRPGYGWGGPGWGGGYGWRRPGWGRHGWGGHGWGRPGHGWGGGGWGHRHW